MPARVDAIGLVVADLARAIAFYRQLGVPFPEGAEQSEHGHAEANLDSGLRLMLDTEAEIRSFELPSSTTGPMSLDDVNSAPRSNFQPDWEASGAAARLENHVLLRRPRPEKGGRR